MRTESAVKKTKSMDKSVLNNISVFEDTVKLCSSNAVLRKMIKKSIDSQKIIYEHEELSDLQLNQYEDCAEIVVSTKRTLEAAEAYKGKKVAVHNFASATNPGGGVVKGSRAQEECICRCSDLYFCLDTDDMWAGFYKPHRNAMNPLNNGDVIYTPDVCIFKTDSANPELRDESEWYKVDVITCAAPNLREKPTNRFNPGNGDKTVKIDDNELRVIHEKRLSRMLDVAIQNEVEVIILGAWGCGAFKNSPNVVAEAAYNVIQRYLHAFKTIEFAIYCLPKDDVNFKTFKKTFSK